MMDHNELIFTLTCKLLTMSKMIVTYNAAVGLHGHDCEMKIGVEIKQVWVT